MKKIIITIIFTAAITSILSLSFSYAATSYVISAEKIGYTDNSSLGVTNVQAAIDGTCTKFSNQLTELKKSMYPVGSIYISTKLSTTTAVAAVIGGTWQAFGDGKVLRSSTGTSEQTGGSSDVTLTTANLPSHTHTVTATGTVSSTFKGTAVTSGNNSKTPTASFAGTKGTTSSDGSHNHELNYGLGSTAYLTGGSYYMVLAAGTNSTAIATAGAHTHTFTPSGTVTLSNTTHTHSVTAAGTVSSTFAGTAATTTATGGGTKFSTIDPYITVYMYKRIS